MYSLISGSAEGSDTVGGVAAAFKAPELEKKMRENIIRRGGVYSFKIGSGGKSDSAPHKAEEDQRQSAGQYLVTRSPRLLSVS